MSTRDVESIADRFDHRGRLLSVESYGRGHINDTYVAETDHGGSRARFVLQRINEHVFKNPRQVMENVQRVIAHLAERSGDDERCLTLIPTHDGAFFLEDESGCWRAYEYVGGTRSYDVVPETKFAAEAAAIFGRFQHLLHDLPAPALHETIPGFHDTPARYSQLRNAVARDEQERATSCRAEIDFALAREEVASTLASLQAKGELPIRIAHNDTKLNNILFDEHTGQAVCVVDLDTVMPGNVLCDFGDLVRSAAGSGSEDTTDLPTVDLRMDLYEALVKGYLATAREFLTSAEIDNLAVSGLVITIETGVRFLTDHLAGDQYFRIQRPMHNLDRCRAQFALAASIAENLEEMRAVTARVAGTREYGGTTAAT